MNACLTSFFSQRLAKRISIICRANQLGMVNFFPMKNCNGPRKVTR